MATTLDKVIGTVWRSFLVGVGYIAALMIGGMLASMVGTSMLEVEDTLSRLMWPFAGGTIRGESASSCSPA